MGWAGAARTALRIALAGAAAALLTACAQRTIPYPVLAERYASADSRWIVLSDGNRLHYRDQGPRDAEPIVLVHGFAASLHAWEPWVAQLHGRYRLISLDLPGHGLTEAPKGYRVTPQVQVRVVDDLTRTLGVDRFVIAGNSMGGAVAWRYALAHPDKVLALVLVDAAGWPGNARGSGPPAVFKLLSNPAGRAVLKSIDLRPLARGGLKKAYVDPALVTDPLVARYVDLASAPGHKDVLLTQRVRDEGVTPRTFAAITAPTLVMSGEADALIPAADAQAFAKAIPGARLILYPGVGHVPMEQIPERSAADLDAFLRARTPGSTAAQP